MKLGKRSLVLAVALMLALSASVFSTIAYLTSSAQATNTFTVGDVEIDLDETDVDEDGNPKYPVDTDGDGKPDVEISIDENGTITVDPTPDDPTDDPIVIKPDEDDKYPPTDIDGDGKDDQIEVGGGTITVTPGNGGDPIVILPGDVTVDEDGTITIDPACPDCEDIVIKPDENGDYPNTDVNGDGVKDEIDVDEDGNVIIIDGATEKPIVGEPDKDNENDYNLVPGAEYLKDPTITVKADSEECYVRFRVGFSELPEGADAVGAFDTLVKDLNEENWFSKGPNADGELEFWYVENGNFVTVEPSKSNDLELPALFTTVGVPGEVTSEELQVLAGVQMIVEGDAIQAASFDNADEAWKAFDGQNNGTIL
ncbi:MAG: hypothetical protein IJN44_00400 [Clostridia bacterium]|nr:hypothetical protein [Clostridia bacterium]